tara:strand:+ start:202 stop:555 length:354 start_codon:yes stop_codon:yes gene_type:complete
MNTPFKMNQGAHSDNDTPTGFRNYVEVAKAGGNSGINMGEPLNYGTPMKKTDPKKKSGRREGESREDYGKRVFAESQAKAQKRKEAKEKGTNKTSGRAGDFSFGPIKGNVNRYGEGG